MLTLIKREFEANLASLLIAVVLAVVLATITASQFIPEESDTPPIGIPMAMYTILWWLLPFWPIGCAALGATQMYFDRNKKIPAFLSTLATTRRRILTAKILTGLLWILVVLSPLLATGIILLWVYPRPAPVDISFFARIFVTLSLACLACYALGLQLGYHQGTILRVLGTFVAAPVLTSVIIIKGFGLQTSAILLLLTAALMVRVWQKFMSTPL